MLKRVTYYIFPIARESATTPVIRMHRLSISSRRRALLRILYEQTRHRPRPLGSEPTLLFNCLLKKLRLNWTARRSSSSGEPNIASIHIDQPARLHKVSPSRESVGRIPDRPHQYSTCAAAMRKYGFLQVWLQATSRWPDQLQQHPHPRLGRRVCVSTCTDTC